MQVRHASIQVAEALQLLDDLFVGIGVICVMAAVRFVRRPSLYRLAIVIAGITFVGPPAEVLAMAGNKVRASLFL